MITKILEGVCRLTGGGEKTKGSCLTSTQWLGRNKDRPASCTTGNRAVPGRRKEGKMQGPNVNLLERVKKKKKEFRVTAGPSSPRTG